MQGLLCFGIHFQFFVLEKRAVKLDSVAASLEESDIGDKPRRSQRNRVPCLQYWKNDRIEYERRQSGIKTPQLLVRT